MPQETWYGPMLAWLLSKKQPERKWQEERRHSLSSERHAPASRQSEKRQSATRNKDHAQHTDERPIRKPGAEKKVACGTGVKRYYVRAGTPCTTRSYAKSYHTTRNISGTASRLERSVAFFGAVDSRPYLFMLNVALQSVRRFHPLAGYFALLPRVDPHAKCRKSELAIDDCSARGLLRSWSGSFIKPLTLPRHKETLFDLPVRSSWSSSMEGNRANDGVTFVYSRMTFLRHWVPQVLALRGYTFSVSLDPDTLCVRAWDLRILQRVQLLGGRPVGTSARTKGWLQQASSSSSGTSTNLTIRLQEMNLTASLLKRRTELNGGVLVFNNSECMRVRWGQTLAKYYAQLNDVVESDQDLMSLVLTAEPSFGRYLLPSVYNYAFRRDRERLPYTLAHRLRHGLVGHFKSSGTRGELIMVHFVQDGKPWQPQQLTSYPPWLLAVRLFHITDWLGIARLIKPTLFSSTVSISDSERQLLGPKAKTIFKGGRKNEVSAMSALVDRDAFRRCRCFIRGLADDPMANQTSRLARRHAELNVKSVRTKSSLSAAQATDSSKVARGTSSSRELNAARKQRQLLLQACCADQCARPASRTCACSHSLQVSADEQHLCDKDRQAAAKRFNCQLAAKRSAGDGWTPNNCSAVAGRQAVTRKATLALRSRVYFCRECWTSSREEDD